MLKSFNNEPIDNNSIKHHKYAVDKKVWFNGQYTGTMWSQKLDIKISRLFQVLYPTAN